MEDCQKLKLGGAVIHSHETLPVKLEEQTLTLIEKLISVPPKAIFNAEAVGFIKALSKKLLTETSNKYYPDLVALGFWLRDSNIKRMHLNAKQETSKSGFLFRKPLGTIMHICPSNVDTMFVYSWVCGILMGNNNIVRVPSNTTETQSVLLACIAELLTTHEFSSIAARNIVVNWPSDGAISKRISALVQGRMIWGGDDTIADIKSLATQPGCRDISFSDKFSVAAIRLTGLTDKAMNLLAEKLWTDISTFQQAACSSPKLLVFCGECLDLNQKLYEKLEVLARTDSASPVWRMNHLVTEQLLKSQNSNNTVKNFNGFSVQNLEHLEPEYFGWHPSQNYLYEYQTQDFASLLEQLPENCQTISHFGFDSYELTEALAQHSRCSVDRVVRMGQALDFSENWDGYEIMKQLSRVIELYC